ncbi:MAG TPA: carboxypeptidase-like regulatory domain-containing protein, partial [Thermoanaerobaculia bacterium]|nr:carboxypeptidase-like regulatory domain-containing protein [Thermoanaerobaculia bacterium]
AITAFVPEGSREQLQRLEKRAARTPLRTTKTEAGRFALAELPDSIIDVAVRAEGFAPVVARVLTGDAPLSITLHPVTMTGGRITAAGKPVADAYVVWIGENDADYTATTDANGRYRAPDVRRWAREPMVFHASHATLKDSGRGAEGLDLELRARTPEEPRPAGTAKLTGIVRLGDKPLAGVPLIIQGTGERFVPPVRVVTDAKGRYSASGLIPVRTYVGPAPGLEPRIRAHQGAQMMEGNAPASIDLAKDGDATLDIALFKAPMISGRVVDAEGKPVAGAQAQVILAGRSSLDFMHDAAARTTADGRYAVAAPPFQPTESVTVAINARNRSTVRSKPFTLGSGDHRVDVTLPQFHNVTVRVVDRAGKPVPKAQVAFADSEETVAFTDPRPLLMQPFVTRAVRANESGEVQLQLAPGTYDLVAEADRYQIGFIAGRNITRPGAVDLTLEQAFAIRGRVHRNGVGVANANVSMLGNEGAPRDQAIVTDADGRFEIGGLARNKYRLGIFKHDELIQRIVSAQAPGELEVALPPAGTLRARVIDAATREPVREFIYSVEPLEAIDDQARTGRPMMER